MLLVVVNGLATWIGGAITDAGVSAADAVAAVANGLPVILLFGGLAVAMFGLAPRLTIAVPVGGVVVAYILSFIGPALDFPGLADRNLAVLPPGAGAGAGLRAHPGAGDDGSRVRDDRPGRGGVQPPRPRGGLTASGTTESGITLIPSRHGHDLAVER